MKNKFIFLVNFVPFFFSVGVISKYYKSTTLVGCIGIGGVINSGKSVYDSYKLHRNQSYSDCVIQTTIGGVGGFGLGMLFGGWAYFVTPVILPIFCLAVPIAGGTAIAKYFDKEVKTP